METISTGNHNKGELVIKEEVMDAEKEDDKVEEEKEQEVEEQKEKDSKDDTTDQLRHTAWKPIFYSHVAKEVHYFAGHEISIWESLDSFGATIWPGALALCRYLETQSQVVNLMDKAVLEIGAGTGLVSIVASLLGGWVTATDLPEVLSNLRCNLSRNTRGRCRFAPQVAALSWGHDLQETFPHSIYRYDYILAADVVYLHDFLPELLITMQHFCQPGTTLIWSNKVRFKSDLAFTENFKKAFKTTLLAEMEDLNIYMATAKECKEELQLEMDAKEQDNEELTGGRGDGEVEECEEDAHHEDNAVLEEGVHTELHRPHELTLNEETSLQNSEETEDGHPDHREWMSKDKAEFHENSLTEQNAEEYEEHATDDVVEDRNISESDKDDQEEDKAEENVTEAEELQSTAPEDNKDTDEHAATKRVWVPSVYYTPGKEIYYFAGETITIMESIDSYGGLIWPAATALCKYLDTAAGREQINLLDKLTLEIGAGTGLLSIVATLLGARVTATDLPDLLGNLRFNLNRNTRHCCRHMPEVAALSWGHELEETFPRAVHHYDYVLAADVVYHHDALAELLVTMQHFCQPGTTLIWANKIRFHTDLVFTENFKKAFKTSLLAELDEVKIYMATANE